MKTWRPFWSSITTRPRAWRRRSTAPRQCRLFVERLELRALLTAPVAVDDRITGAENTPLTPGIYGPGGQGVLANDIDADGDLLTSVLVAGPTNGTLTLNVNGSFTYTPKQDYSGIDGFTYRANDGVSTSNLATVTITVKHVDNLPVATSDIYSMKQNTSLTVPVLGGLLMNDSDPGGDTLTVNYVNGSNVLGNAVATPRGTLYWSLDDSFAYTPATNFVGSDSFTYQVSNGFVLSKAATVTINVTVAGDRSPVAVNDSYTAVKDAALAIPSPGVLANDSDPDGDTLTALLVGRPTHGTLYVTLGGTLYPLNYNLYPPGSFYYVSAPGYTGRDSFTYRASDGQSSSNAATVTINVQPVNDPPVANNDRYTTPRNFPLTVATPGVLGNDTDVDGDTLTAALVNGPARGTLTLNANGSFAYSPIIGFTGTDSFSYLASDASLSSGAATVTISVCVCALFPPTAVNDSFTTLEDISLTVSALGVLANDTIAHHFFCRSMSRVGC